jgi:putative transcriptional regulator
MHRIKKLEGNFLIAMPNMGDSRFSRTLIFLCAHSSEGAMGFVVNKRLEHPTAPEFLTQLNIVSEAEAGTLPAGLRDMPVRSGGPVEPGRGFILHSPDYSTASTLQIAPTISLTATLEILRAIATGRGPKKYILLLGYSGWAGGQLEAEIGANGWLTSLADDRLVFASRDEAKYDLAMRAIGVDPHFLSGEAGHA